MRRGPDAAPTLQLHHLGHGVDLPDPMEMLTILDPMERRRADRFTAPAHATPFITGRYLLRLLAANTVEAEPRSLVSDFTCPVCGQQDTRSDHGRPGYTLDGDRLPIALSLSRAPNAVLLGALDLRDPQGSSTSSVSSRTRIGVDVDLVAGVLFDGFDDVALSPAEREIVANLPRDEQDSARARLWVRKEALVKAQGMGFSSSSPADVDVVANPRITDIADLAGHSGVTLERLGLVAAVAVV